MVLIIPKVLYYALRLRMIYFTADTHFNHDINKHFKRPFETLEQMNETLIKNWNLRVNENDEIYILGDFYVGNNISDVEMILKKLNGRKYFIKGNHDKFLENESFNKNYFEWIKEYYVLNYEKINIVLFHYPILIWDGFFENMAIHLYGHIHNMLGNKNELEKIEGILGIKTLNVGVDINSYSPISIVEILNKIQI